MCSTCCDVFRVVLNNPLQSYLPGELISGAVIVNFRSKKLTTGLDVTFRGQAKLKWAIGKCGHGQGVIETDEIEHKIKHRYHNSHLENYFNWTVNLLRNFGRRVKLSPGKNVYPFQFTLPLALPSSFKGRFGCVTYKITAVLKRPWCKSKFKSSVNVIVNAPVDLNSIPDVSDPIVLEKQRNFCNFNSSVNPAIISFTLRIEKAGYLPGETISSSVTLTNHSQKNVHKITLTLIQKSFYYPTKKSKRSDTKCITKVIGPGVAPGEIVVWNGNLITIPDLPSSKLGHCKIIEVTYLLQLEMYISGLWLKKNLRGRIPITIGTIPIHHFSSPDLSQESSSFVSEIAGEIVKCVGAST